jgi:hypothetical protein
MSLNFFIKKNSTLAIIKYPLSKQILDKYYITSDMLDNSAITFSMKNLETGIFSIANVNAELLHLPDRASYPSDEEYSLVYKIKKNQINKIGIYAGEFAIDFLGDFCGKIILPDNDILVINILDTSVKTDVF